LTVVRVDVCNLDPQGRIRDVHILTGMIITALLRKRSQGGVAGDDALPRFRTGPIRVIHTLPGRVRFQVPSLGADPDGCARLASNLSRLEGVDAVTANPTSGSVLIRFDEERVKSHLLLAAISRLLGLDEQMQRTPTPLVARELNHMGSGLNRAFLEQTRGLIDLRTAAMIALGVVGVRKLLAEGGGSLPAGMTLVWWATNSLVGRHSDAVT
jgi:hypothetical protein